MDIDPVALLKRGVRGLRVAVMPRREREGVAPEILARFDASLDVLANLGVRDNDFDPARTAHFGRIFNRPPRPPADPNAPARPPRDGRILKMIFEYLPMILQLLGTFGVIPKLPTP